MGRQGEVADTDCRRPSYPANESSIFYRMIVPSIIQDKKLRIPGKFVKKFENVLPAVATLTTPNGCVWQVRLKKIDGKVCFTDGWHDFVEHQSIRVGHLLVFTFEGNSNFSVNIYDIATAEIKYQCNTWSSSEGPSCGNRCPVPYKEEAENDESIKILDSRPTCQAPASLENKVFDEFIMDQFEHGCFMVGKNLNLEDHKGMREANSVNEFQAKLIRTGMYDSHGFDGSELKNSKYKANGGNLHVDFVQSAAQSTRDIGIQCSYNELMTSAYEVKLHSLNQRPEMTRKRKRGIGPYELESSAKRGSKVQIPGSETSCGTFLRRWRVVTPEEKERVLNASKMFQSENPFCRVILRRSYVYKGIGLHMPSSFAEKYLGGVSGFITLQVSSGEKWPVRCMWRDGSAKLSKGWPEFVCSNRLEEGDVCVFELVKMGEVVLKVTIFHVVEDAGQMNQLLKEHLSQTSQMAMDYDLNG